LSAFVRAVNLIYSSTRGGAHLPEGGKCGSPRSRQVIKTRTLCGQRLSFHGARQRPRPDAQRLRAAHLENAKKVATLAIAEAAKNNWAVAVAIVDPSGNLVYYEKMDNTQLGSARIAIEKAATAAKFKRPTQAFQDALAKGAENWRILTLSGVVAAEGGIPLVIDGKIVGAIGVSGMTSAQDNQCAKAGAGSLK